MPPQCSPPRRRLDQTASREMITTIAQAARDVLLTGQPRDKAMATKRAARAWRQGRLAFDFDVPMPDRPARPSQPELLPPGQMPKRGRAGSLRSRIALLHALAHIEFVAIDLAWDIVGRFGAVMPRSFTDEWISVAADESMHFALLERRLKMLGNHYGALPAHDGLWEAAEVTKNDLAARLVIVPQVLEARGLDVTPETIKRLESAQDFRSAAILQRIYILMKSGTSRPAIAGFEGFVTQAESIRPQPFMLQCNSTFAAV